MAAATVAAVWEGRLEGLCSAWSSKRRAICGWSEGDVVCLGCQDTSVGMCKQYNNLTYNLSELLAEIGI